MYENCNIKIMDIVGSHVQYKKPKWYNNPAFRLVPYLKIYKANNQRTFEFQFEWLFLKMWLLDSPALSLEAVIDTHWGLGFTAIITYLRVVAAIPCPYKWQLWVYNHWNRRPKQTTTTSTTTL